MLNKKILSYKTSSLLKSNKAKRLSTNYQYAESIGIIYTSEDLEKHHIVKDFKKSLEDDGKKVNVLTLLPKGLENFEFLFDFFTTKDISFWGNFTAEQVHKFVNATFDYLFYLDTKSNLLIKNILAMSKAKCRVGKFDETDRQFFELMIDTPSNSTRELVNEMYKYTKILN
ncbi:hypothetical protein LVD15_20220 [Fulvivirga maritima]|uniref:DUF6913 domain-containing protein n=1 Tax=Fulvivirga maritima TaxID=2904247 RepID=UPI001F305C57|nr:hypothetical protein [Fulvivirga maritima]UII25610.1 hypothetical protein LVD15_20220 [Fulvivirga maritima]